MVKKQQLANKKENPKIICSVCMEKSARASIDCQHKFCMICISKWVKRNSSCPLCRSDITSIKYGKTTKKVEPRRKNLTIFRSTPPNVRVRMTWKPIIFVRLSYFNYFVPGGTIVQPFLF